MAQTPKFRLTKRGHGVTVKIPAETTERWARGEYGSGRWPCSTLAGSSLYLEFEGDGDLVEMLIDGCYDEFGDVDGIELDALLETLLGTAHPRP